MKKSHERVVIIKSLYVTPLDDYLPVTYDIEVDDNHISSISEFSAQYIYKELGKLLYPEKKNDEQK